MAPTHIWNVTDAVPSERYREGRRSATQGVQGRSLQVDARVEQDHRCDQSADAQRGRGREHGHADRGQHEPRDHERQPPTAARAGAIGEDTGQRHQQQQEHVVDRHHRADEGAPVAQGVPHENRDERGEQRDR